MNIAKSVGSQSAAHSSFCARVITIVLSILLFGNRSSPVSDHNGRNISEIPGQWESRTGDNCKRSNSYVFQIATCTRPSPGVSSVSDKTAAPKIAQNNPGPGPPLPWAFPMLQAFSHLPSCKRAKGGIFIS